MPQIAWGQEEGCSKAKEMQVQRPRAGGSGSSRRSENTGVATAK